MTDDRGGLPPLPGESPWDASGPTRVLDRTVVAPHRTAANTFSREIEGRFRVERELGAGGMGEVYLATDPALERFVALKVIRPEILEDPHWLDRFRLEATVSAGLQHPNIVQVYDILQAAGRPVLVMEYVDGTDLKHALQTGALDETEVVRIMAEVCDGLAFAHMRGVIHRDIKPGNIMLARDGVPKIADFGLATQGGRSISASIDAAEQDCVLGSPGYMSPEQARGDQRAIGNSRTDIYSLGATLYFALTGRSPVDGVSQTALVDAVINGDIRPPSQVRPSVNRDLEAVCLKALATQPEHRYASAAEMARDLRNALAGRPLLARRYGRWETLRRAVAYKRAAFIAGVAAVVLAFAGIATAVLGLHTIAKTQLFEGMRTQVMDLANLAALMVDPAQINTVLQDPAGAASAAQQLQDLVTAVRDRSPDLRYAWIMRRAKAASMAMAFVADSRPRRTSEDEVPPPEDTPAQPGELFDATPFPELVHGFDRPTADRSYAVTDEWGIALSGYAPIRDGSGQAIAVLGVDMADVELAARFAQLDRALLVTLVLSAALSLLALYLIASAIAGLWSRQR